ncbi:MAG: GIY-YIG nuclease family protein, partial [Acidobacteriaceae bacterium]
LHGTGVICQAMKPNHAGTHGRAPLLRVHHGQPFAKPVHGHDGNIEARAVQHKTKHFAGFTSDYNCNRLVWYESFDNPNRAIDREKQIKRWVRAKKLALINKMNPAWIDLSEDWGKPLQPMLSDDTAKMRVHSTRV